MKRTVSNALLGLLVSGALAIMRQSVSADQKKRAGAPAAAPANHVNVADARKKVSDAEADLNKAQAAFAKAVAATRETAASSPEMTAALTELKEARAAYEEAKAAALKGIAGRNDYQTALTNKRRAEDAKDKLAEDQGNSTEKRFAVAQDALTDRKSVV